MNVYKVTLANGLVIRVLARNKAAAYQAAVAPCPAHLRPLSTSIEVMRPSASF